MKTERRRRARRAAGGEQVLEGIGVSRGIAIGPAHVVESGTVEVLEYRIAARAVNAEQDRFVAAVDAAREQIAGLSGQARRLPAAAREELGHLLDAHVEMLAGSRLVRGARDRIAAERINAEAAVRAELATIAEAFAGMDDPYLASRIDDVREVAQRLIRNLTRAPHRAFSDLPDGAVVIADDLTPADIALLDPNRVAGFAAELGGAQGHTAIMARSLGLPAVLGISGLLSKVRSGEPVVLDGGTGRLIARPKQATVDAMRRRRRDLARRRRGLARLRNLPAVTRDGVEIRLQANLDLPGEITAAIDVGADGVGLLRSEFMYMNRDTPPDEDEQYAAMRGLVEAMDGRPVTVRTLDVGSDKLAYSLDGGAGLGTGVNPALGLRAIRLSLSIPKLLDTQLAAMLRAAQHGPLRILLPMITNASEMRKVREAMERVARRLRRARHPIAEPLPPLGAMIEIPAAALAADRLVVECDFLSIGTNDLTMYTLAVDRGDDHVAHLYDPLHPAVLRLIQFATEAALRAGVPVNLCGEIAGDARYAPLLLGLGLRDLSMTPVNLPMVKKRIRALDFASAARLAETIMGQSDSGRIAAVMDDFNSVM